MSDVLLKLLYKLGKRDKMQGLLSILSIPPNLFNILNKIGACNYVCFYLSYDIKITLKWLFCQ